MSDASGRILAIDFGLKRVGAAISDPTRAYVSPLEVYHRNAPEADARHYRRLVEDEGAVLIVVGLPLHSSGDESRMADLARAFGAWLAEVTGLPVRYFDERYTSKHADELLHGHGLTARERKTKRDMIAAMVLLRDYIDAGCPEVEAPGRPLDDRGGGR